MIVNLFHHGPSRPASSSTSRPGSRPPSARVTKPAGREAEKLRPFSARTPKTGACDQPERGNHAVWTATENEGNEAEVYGSRRPITARARMQGDFGKRPPSAETRISRVSSKDTQPQQLPSTSGATKRGQSVNDTGRDEDKDGIAPARPSLELETVNEESRSWSRKDVDLHASPKDGHTDGHALVALDGNAPLEALPAKTRELACRDEEEIPGGNTKRGPRSPNRRRSRPVRGNLMGACQRPGQDGQERSVYRGGGAQGKAAWPLVSETTVPLSLGDQLEGLSSWQESVTMPSLVDATRETGSLDAKRPADTRDVSVAVDGGGGAGDGGYLRRKVPMKEEFRQMVQENKMRSEALRRSVHAIESLSAALDANNGEKQLLVTVLLSLTQQASDARDSSGLGRRGPREGGKPAQVAFVSEMVGMSMQERGVLEHMPGQVVDAVEDALRLKMAHAETRVALAQLDAQLMEWQTWYSSTARVGGEDSVRTKVPRLPVEKIQATPRIHGSEQPRDWQDGPVAAAHVRSQLSAVRVENERLRLQLQEMQHRVLGKSPRGRDSDGTQLVLDLLHKDLAAAKAQNHILQAEISSMADHCKRIQADAGKQADKLLQQMSDLTLQLDAGKQEVARAKKQAAEAATREVAALAALEEARMATSKAIAAEQAAAAAAQAAHTDLQARVSKPPCAPQQVPVMPQITDVAVESLPACERGLPSLEEDAQGKDLGSLALPDVSQEQALPDLSVEDKIAEGSQLARSADVSVSLNYSLNGTSMFEGEADFLLQPTGLSATAGQASREDTSWDGRAGRLQSTTQWLRSIDAADLGSVPDAMGGSVWLDVGGFAVPPALIPRAPAAPAQAGEEECLEESACSATEQAAKLAVEAAPALRRRSPSFTAKQPATLQMDVIKATPRDLHLEQEAGEQRAWSSVQDQCVVAGHDAGLGSAGEGSGWAGNSLASPNSKEDPCSAQLDGGNHDAVAITMEASSSMCKANEETSVKTEESAREPHDPVTCASNPAFDAPDQTRTAATDAGPTTRQSTEDTVQLSLQASPVSEHKIPKDLPSGVPALAVGLAARAVTEGSQGGDIVSTPDASRKTGASEPGGQSRARPRLRAVNTANDAPLLTSDLVGAARDPTFPMPLSVEDESSVQDDGAEGAGQGRGVADLDVPDLTGSPNGHGVSEATASASVSAEQRPRSARHRPVSAKLSRDGGSAQSAATAASSARSALMQGGLSPIVDTSLAEVSGVDKALSSSVCISDAEREMDADRGVANSICISDASAESDEDVLADPQLDRDEPEDERGGGGGDGALRRRQEGGKCLAVASVLGDSSPLEQSGAVGTRELAASEDLRVQMEMVQQYTQFEKIGSTLQGVAEEEEEEEVPREDFTAGDAAEKGGRREIPAREHLIAQHVPTRPDDRRPPSREEEGKGGAGG